MWLDRISIPRKLTLAFAITLSSSAISSVIIYNAMQDRAHTSQLSTLTNAQQLATMSGVAAHLDMAQTVRGFLLTGVERHKRLYEAAAVSFNEHITKAIELGDKADSHRGVVNALRGMQTASHQWKSEIGDNIIRLATDPATRPEGLAIAMSPRSSEFQQRFRDAQSDALKLLIASERAFEEAESDGERATYYSLLIGGLGALFLGLGSAYLLSRNLARPLENLTKQIDQLARGDTHVKFAGVDRKDGIGQIASACETLKSKLLEREQAELTATAQRREAEGERERLSTDRAEEARLLQESLAIFALAMGGLARGDLVTRMDVELHGPAEELRGVFNNALLEMRECARRAHGAAPRCEHEGTRGAQPVPVRLHL